MRREDVERTGLWYGSIVCGARSVLHHDIPKCKVLSGVIRYIKPCDGNDISEASDEDNVSDDVALAVMRNTVVNMRRVLADIDDVQARGNLMWDLQWQKTVF